MPNVLTVIYVIAATLQIAQCGTCDSTCKSTATPIAGYPGRNGHNGTPGIPGRDGLPGTQGMKGDKGDQGSFWSSPGGGSVYTRWGRTTCPDTPGTELVYDGYTAGTEYAVKGGASNILCLPKVPKYATWTPGVDIRNGRLATMEYETIGIPPDNSTSVFNHNAPCAVCSTPRSRQLMMPARDDCPTGWTTEYSGYLATESPIHYRSQFLCFDRSLETIAGGEGNHAAAAEAWNVEIVCGIIPCPPYDREKELTCAICTK